MTPAEATARAVKAQSLADVLAETGCSSADAEHLDDRGWANAVMVATQRRRRPMGVASVETRRLVIDLLRERELASDAFEGLPQ